MKVLLVAALAVAVLWYLRRALPWDDDQIGLPNVPESRLTWNQASGEYLWDGEAA